MMSSSLSSRLSLHWVFPPWISRAFMCWRSALRWSLTDIAFLKAVGGFCAAVVCASNPASFIWKWVSSVGSRIGKYQTEALLLNQQSVVAAGLGQEEWTGGGWSVPTWGAGMGRCPNHKNSHGKHYSHKTARRAKFLVKDILATSSLVSLYLLFSKAYSSSSSSMLQIMHPEKCSIQFLSRWGLCSDCLKDCSGLGF